MRLIDADALEFTHAIARSLDDGHNWNEMCITADEIADTPSIDIVRCCECKYKRINEDGETRYYYCALEVRPNRQWSVDDTDYCSWGEVDDEQMD